MRRPNIILISIDTLRADHVSCYGYERSITPNIDRLAREGVLFKHAYSTAVWTPPAHASMLTGLHPREHGVVHQNRLVEDIPTIAELLQKNGYQTAGFVNNSQVGELVGLNRGHDDFYEVWRGLTKKQIFRRLIHKVREVMGSTDHGASQTNKLVFHWLTKKWNRDKPFYLFLHHIDAHNPLKAPHPFRYKFLDERVRKQVDMTKIWRVADNPLVCFTDEFQLNAAEVEAVTCLYDEEINYVDHKIGQLVEYLTDMRLLDDTMLILTADHGEHLGERGLYSHVASLYEPIVSIPLILRYPEWASGTVSHEYVQHIDIFPTILEVAGSGKNDGLKSPGKNLFESLQKNEVPRILFAEWEGRIPHFVRARLNEANRHSIEEHFSNKLWMCRKDRFKLIADSRGHFELYDTEKDPEEKINLYKTEHTIFQELQAALDEWTVSTEEKKSESYDYSEETLRKHLEALGYL